MQVKDKVHIFLDVDGVLNCNSDWSIPHKRRRQLGAFVICEEKVQRFLNLVKELDAVVVLSSTWRLYDDAKKVLREMGITWVSQTGGMRMSSSRGQEILEWLENHPVSKFIIFDDDPSPQRFPELKDHQVLTHASEGLQQKHIDKALEMLKNP